ncbi:Fc receptor-like protein 5 isoform X3 [Salarias fasciatus]|nr:Fc receptor-like protein 5 isoform X3 [Salarias fasciatus]
MGSRLFSHLWFFLFGVLLCRGCAAEKPRATLTSGNTTISVGGSVSLSCSVRDSDGWKYEFYTRTSNTWEKLVETNVEDNGVIQVSKGGIYRCRGERETSGYLSDMSDEAYISITFTNKPVITRQPSWSQIFQGEEITLTCEVQGGEKTDWWYYWSRNSQYLQQKNEKFLKVTASQSINEKYDCMASRTDDSFSSTTWSEAFTVSVLQKSRATLTSGNTTISVGGSVSLSCSVRDSDGWKYEFYRKASNTWEKLVETNVGDNGTIQVSKGGIYRCRGERETSGYLSDMSDEAGIQITFTNKPVITRQPSWSQIFQGEEITLTCEVQGGEKTDWWYYWSRNSQYLQQKNKKVLKVTQYFNEEYKCMATRKDDSSSSTTWSEAFTVSVLPQPKAQLGTNKFNMSEGSRVTLTCSVNQPAGWKYFWYRDSKTSPLNTHDTDEYQSQSEVSQEGRYWCRGGRGGRGGRGDPLYYTEYSDPISVTKIIPNKATLTLQHDRPQLYQGETIALRCAIDGGNTGWEYEWETSSLLKPANVSQYRMEALSSQHQGEYRCKGNKLRGAQSTDWSNTVTLTVFRPKLSVSPSWLIPGASVTLICHTEPPSAGWSFYWFKAVPNSQDSYTYEPLPGTSSGTANNSFTVHGQTHTAGYACSAGRGDPPIYTQHSRPTFVWSSGVHPSASLTVNPDRVQHFTSESLSLTCEGSSSQWRLIRFLTDDSLLSFLPPATINGSTYIKNEAPRKAVYWCESGTEFSNAVNISTHSDGVILVSPVYPVPVGESVTLLCVMKTGNIPSDVFFYKNNKLIENERRGEMKISAVSESDEGFYKCQYNGRESAQSWMAVQFTSRPGSSSSGSLMIIRWICGVLLLIVLLLLLCFYNGSRDSCFNRSQSSQQSQTTDHSSNQLEDQCNTYASLIQADDNPYETIQETDSPDRDESRNVMYSSMELQEVKKVKKQKPEEGSIYPEVKTTSWTDSSVTSAQVHSNESQVNRSQS